MTDRHRKETIRVSFFNFFKRNPKKEMESFTITLTGNEPELKSVFFPPIELNGDYVIGLVTFKAIIP